jgi:hypothetical protein
MVSVIPYRQAAREAWQRHTLGEMSAATGLSPSCLHGIMWGPKDYVRQATALKLRGLQALKEHA